MVIETILQQLTQDRKDRELKAVLRKELPPDLEKWVKGYQKVGERDEFIWKWLFTINPGWIYTPVHSDYAMSLGFVKTLYNMFIILLDDVSEKNMQVLLNELVKIPFHEQYIDVSRLSSKDKEYLTFTHSVWKQIDKIIRQYPHHDKIRDFFDYETSQFINAVKYAYLIYKHPNAINTAECWMYIPYSMQILVNFDMDLMCSSDLREEDMGQARKTVFFFQQMCRIGNWLTTWEREIKEGDFSSIIIPYCIEEKIINHQDLNSQNKDQAINKIKQSPAEEYFLKTEWENRYNELTKLSQNSVLINSEAMLEKIRYLILMHLISRGWK